jgi:hypothetical protein
MTGRRHTIAARCIRLWKATVQCRDGPPIIPIRPTPRHRHRPIVRPFRLIHAPCVARRPRIAATPAKQGVGPLLNPYRSIIRTGPSRRGRLLAPVRTCCFLVPGDHRANSFDWQARSSLKISRRLHPARRERPIVSTRMAHAANTWHRAQDCRIQKDRGGEVLLPSAQNHDAPLCQAARYMKSPPHSHPNALDAPSHPA